MGENADLDAVTTDLTDEHASLDAIAAPLNEGEWHSPTPSVGWSVQDQIAHLTYFDGTATLAIASPDDFAAHVKALFAAAGEVGSDEATLGALRRVAPSELLAQWRANRSGLLDAAKGLADGDRVPWYGPSMSAKSFLAARLMETWAHGTDVARAIGVNRAPTDRLFHVARLGYLTRGWSYSVRGLGVPTTSVRVDLAAPSGGRWRFGPDVADDAVVGDAQEFCLVVTQRCHVDDTELTAGAIGREWLAIAQAFAGGPTDPPEPRRSR
jgi:uncharacterized protein (TIGR03084 family)